MYLVVAIEDENKLYVYVCMYVDSIRGCNAFGDTPFLGKSRS